MLQLDDSLHRLVIAFDLPLCLWMLWFPRNMFHVELRVPSGKEGAKPPQGNLTETSRHWIH